MPEEKLHWKRLKEVIEKFKNGKITTLYFEDSLPVRIGEIEGKDKEIDLTK